eukprot:gnl/Hemi2/14812_TR5026_c0_g1_i1.p1 gnl/Hemi2/14812_TR5026_c0_g1~~gnl/Hemi2/14812_TR5026_c0_g1_i1.p1  ORF type:complete len:153 (-),score=7.56 gnl/Hemi2/14812_TR5026_c0_g1_i1:37-495(-)
MLNRGCARHVVNIDCNSTAIEIMKNSERKANGGGKKSRQVDSDEVLFSRCEYLEMNTVAMQFPDASFDVIVGKGLLDALLSSFDPDPPPFRNTLAEVSRVLCPGGYYLEFSGTVPPDMLPSLSNPRYGWAVTVQPSSNHDPPYFIYVARRDP